MENKCWRIIDPFYLGPSLGFRHVTQVGPYLPSEVNTGSREEMRVLVLSAVSLTLAVNGTPLSSFPFPTEEAKTFLLIKKSFSRMLVLQLRVPGPDALAFEP